MHQSKSQAEIYNSGIFAMTGVDEQFVVCEYNRGSGKRHFIVDKADHPQDREESDDSFIVFDLGDVIAKQKKWNELLPQVKPFYAVKCRPYLTILKVMAAMGLGFDCASKVEMDSILKLGVDPSRIVYSHTRKRASSLAFASDSGIDLMTFDDEHELLKIKRIFPTARLLLRLSTYDPTANFSPAELKFGCERENIVKLLQRAKVLKLNVVGVHFNLGTFRKLPSKYVEAIAYSREVFDTAKDLGFSFNILDIGGGFPGEALSERMFEKFAKAVRDGLDKYFPLGCGVEIIAEPGTYYMQSAVTLVTSVIGKRRRNGVTDGGSAATNGSIVHYDYFIDDGLYTTLCDVKYVPDEYPPEPLKKTSSCSRHTGVIYGHACCRKDIIVKSCSLPELFEGDWVVFEDKGDYSHMVTNFNGFKRPFCYYALPANCQKLRHLIEDNRPGKVGTTADSFLIPDDLFQLQREDDSQEQGN